MTICSSETARIAITDAFGATRGSLDFPASAHVKRHWPDRCDNQPRGSALVVGT